MSESPKFRNLSVVKPADGPSQKERSIVALEFLLEDEAEVGLVLGDEYARELSVLAQRGRSPCGFCAAGSVMRKPLSSDLAAVSRSGPIVCNG